MVVTLSLIFVAEAYQARWITFSFTALASTSFIYVALYSQQKWLQTVLTNRWLIYTGTISYGIYLLEKIPPDVAQSLHLDAHPVLLFALAAATTYVLAMLSWSFLEKPCLRLKRFFEVQPISSTKPISAITF